MTLRVAGTVAGTVAAPVPVQPFQHPFQHPFQCNRASNRSSNRSSARFQPLNLSSEKPVSSLCFLNMQRVPPLRRGAAGGHDEPRSGRVEAGALRGVRAAGQRPQRQGLAAGFAVQARGGKGGRAGGEGGCTNAVAVIQRLQSSSSIYFILILFF
jgi:hypothetical protein